MSNVGSVVGDPVSIIFDIDFISETYKEILAA